MIVNNGHIVERGQSFEIAHVCTFRTWEVFVAVYTNKVFQEIDRTARNKLLKDIYVHALLNNCTQSNVKQTNDRKKCQQR